MLKLGKVVATRAITETVGEIDLIIALQRHQKGDWGLVCKEDWEVNDMALKNGNDRILSAYETINGDRFWIITEWDRSVTTILYPDEY